MKTKSFFHFIILFLACTVIVETTVGQARIRISTGWPYGHHYFSPRPYRSTTIISNANIYRKPYYRNGFVNASPYRRNFYSPVKPITVSRFFYGGAYHPYPSYYRPFNRPAFGLTINVLPRGYYPFAVGQSRYFYNNGLFYQPYQNYYRTIAPPLGALVPSLPAAARKVIINNQTYYEHDGTYYLRSYDQPGRYEVVGIDGVLQTDLQQDEFAALPPAAGQPQTTLPENFKTVILDNKVYYVTPAGEYYTKHVDDKGNITYSIEAR